jgi:light-harvesting complex 1 alpha chain
MAEIARPKNPEDDWKVWLVLNPATWLVPILAAVLVIALAVHTTVFSSPYGEAWFGSDAPVVVEVAPAPAAE